jgi:hypothetical protein
VGGVGNGLLNPDGSLPLKKRVFAPVESAVASDCLAMAAINRQNCREKASTHFAAKNTGSLRCFDPGKTVEAIL